MPDPSHNARLNAALVRVYRSLLQYVDECWPWAAHDESAEQRAVRDMAHQQRGFVSGLVDLLAERGWAIDFSNFPTEFTDLHYVSLDYLVGKLIADETDLISFLEQSRSAITGDPSAAALLTHLIDAERRHVAKLRDLAAAHPVAP